jgi:hypothetical protein
MPVAIFFARPDARKRLFVDGGMDRYATELVKTLPEGCLLLNHRVKRWKK